MRTPTEFGHVIWYVIADWQYGRLMHKVHGDYYNRDPFGSTKEEALGMADERWYQR